MILHGKEVKQKLLDGINLVADTVSPTLGPQARTVILQGEPPVIINDGVTITKYVRSEDPYVQMGIQMVQNLASKAQDSSGDGTTTACVLAKELCYQISKLDTVNVHQLRKELELAQNKVLEHLDSLAVKVEDNDILRVATIAANNDEYLGGLIQEAINKVGRDGVITVEESKNHKTELITRDGFRIDEGYLSHLMANGDDGKCTFENPLVFMSNLSFRKFQDLLPVLEIASGTNRPLVIMCKGIDGTALDNLLMNILQKTVRVCAILAPNFGDAQIDELSDISSLLGGKVYNEESKDDPQLVTLEDLGTCDKIIVGKEYTTIVGGEGDVSERISTLREVVEDMTGYDRARIKSRIARLTGGVATIRIGAGSQLEMREKKERLDDALNATKCALSEGIVLGGGVTLHHSQSCLGESEGENIVKYALSSPIMTLIENSGQTTNKEKLGTGMAFDALDCKYKNLDEFDVYDPVLVTKNSFVASMSIASLFLTTDVAVLVGE